VFLGPKAAHITDLSNNLFGLKIMYLFCTFCKICIIHLTIFALIIVILTEIETT
jgi:hypothetical protein